jgi:hypothetical protein
MKVEVIISQNGLQDFVAFVFSILPLQPTKHYIRILVVRSVYRLEVCEARDL